MIGVDRNNRIGALGATYVFESGLVEFQPSVNIEVTIFCGTEGETTR